MTRRDGHSCDWILVMPQSRFSKLVSSMAFDLAVATSVPALIALSLGLLDSPRTVDGLTLTNPTAYDLKVEASGAPGHGWLPIGIVEHGESVIVDDVIDQGETWRFRFTGQSRAAGQVVRARSALVAADWHLTVPEAIGDELARLGAPPSP